jgi:hypothetical protein
MLNSIFQKLGRYKSSESHVNSRTVLPQTSALSGSCVGTLFLYFKHTKRLVPQEDLDSKMILRIPLCLKLQL